MTRVLTALAALAAIGFAAIDGAQQANSQTGEGWIQLFDGKSLDGWTPSNENVNWRVEDGAIVADKTTGKGGNHLVTKNSYKDHMIYAEFWVSEDANSGIFVRCNPKGPIGAKTCYEVNIFDKRPDPSYGTGSIVYFAEANPIQKAGGKWNTFEITAKGRNITVSLNGKQTVNLNNGMFEQGHLTLQYGTGTVKFRKVAVKSL
jgi:3-keto-disaccharide hydrolase